MTIRDDSARHIKTADSPSVRIRRHNVMRRGRVWVTVLFVAGLATVIVGYGGYRLVNRAAETASNDLLLHRVKMQEFRQNVTEQGELASSSNTEIHCQVKSNNTPGTAIIEIVPEGTMVKKGQVVCRLDSSALDQEMLQQQILANTSKALMIQSKNIYDLAVITRDQYLDGEFKELEQTVQSEIFVAEENMRRAEQVLEHSEKMFARGYAPAVQLEADRFALEKAKMDLKVAETKLDVLRNSTRKKMLSQYNTDVLTAEAKWQADKNSHELDLAKLAAIQQQIDLCTILAPADGQIVYANEDDDDWEDRIMIGEGALIRERQVIARLPDPTRMQVDVEIKESRINFVHVGMPATIEVDAVPNAKFSGKVVKVNEYPQRNRWSSSAKEYLVVVELNATHPNIRPGLTARATIHVEEIPNVLQVPVQAVLELGGRHFCLTKNGNSLQRREVTIGSSNNEFVVIRDGLGEDEQVALNIRRWWDRIDESLPEIDPNMVIAQRDDSTTKGNDTSSPHSTEQDSPVVDDSATESVAMTIDERTGEGSEAEDSTIKSAISAVSGSSGSRSTGGGR